MSCDQDLVSSADQPAVDYVLLVTDSSTASPLGDVEVRVTTRNGDTATYRSDAAEGRVEVATVASSQTLFRLSKPGYRTQDVVDTVDAKPDTVFHRAIQKVLRIAMRDFRVDSGRVQVKLNLRNQELEWLRKGHAEFLDSLGNKQVVADHDSDGTLALSGLAKGGNTVTVRHPGYLGRLLDVNVAADSGKAGMITVFLQDLKNSISGQVHIRTASGSGALLDAKVEFHVKDSSAFPRKFTGFTGAELAQDGRFVVKDVPALDGEMWYFKRRTSVEPDSVIAISQAEVLKDGSLPRVVLSLDPDSLSPRLLSGPGKSLPGNDTVGAADTLQFKFNQAVAVERSVKVRLINGAELLIDSDWDQDHTLLKLWPRGAEWSEGKKFEYSLQLLSASGEAFRVPGDTTPVITGSFAVRMPAGGADTTLALPRQIGFAYFNSGSHHRFGAADSNTSPKADSSSEFARLKWKWDANGRRVDSLVIYFQDNRSNPTLSRWGAVPGFLDSTDLVFSDRYATMQVPGKETRFPLRDPGGAITFVVVPKDGGKELRTDTTLEAVTQGMGPAVYAHYDTAGASDSGGVKDSVTVTFRKQRNNPLTAMDWEAGPPDVEVADENNVVNTLSWAWDADKTKGYIIYSLPSVVTKAPRLRAGMNGKSYQGKPVWQKNPKDAAVIE